jgi:hypothetical protein
MVTSPPFDDRCAMMLEINRQADDLRRQLSLGARIERCQCCGMLVAK